MKQPSLLILFVVLLLLTLSCTKQSEKSPDEILKYVPDDKVLFDKIMALDKEYFDAYNTCDMETQTRMFADDIEFFHDKGGLMTSKDDLLKAIEINICSKVTRELVKESVEVYPVANYGAVQIGFHKFHNKEEPDADSNPSKFIAVWKDYNGEWKMQKVFSFH